MLYDYSELKVIIELYIERCILVNFIYVVLCVTRYTDRFVGCVSQSVKKLHRVEDLLHVSLMAR